MRVVAKLFYFNLDDVCKSTSYEKLFLLVCAENRKLINFWLAVYGLEGIVGDLLFLLLQLL